jgi:adenylate cyclase class 2
MEEIEVKFLDIDADKMEKKFLEIGAKKAFDTIYKIKVFDYTDLRLDNDNSWVRLRDEGDKVTLTFKKRLGAKDGIQNDDGMLEHETIVSDFDQTAKILESIGLTQKFYEEKRRIRYFLDDIEFDIDFCPALKPYLEIESDDWNKIDKAILLLGLDPKDKKMFSTTQIYMQNGIRTLDYKELTFKGLVKRG